MRAPPRQNVPESLLRFFRGLVKSQVSCHIRGMIFAGRSKRALADALATLEGRVSELERLRKADLIDMDDMYEKVRRVLGRISKREQRATQEEGDPGNGEPPCSDPISARVRAFREARLDVLGQ